MQWLTLNGVSTFQPRLQNIFFPTEGEVPKLLDSQTQWEELMKNLCHDDGRNIVLNLVENVKYITTRND